MRERDVFIEALQRESVAEREAYLEAACGGDAELRLRVDELLAEHHKPESFFLDAALPGINVTLEQSTAEKSGTQIGPYKLLQQIGEGGMGTVYMAEQTSPVRRRVALKLIKPGMDSRQVIARFEAERQAVAMMDHPNIAKVLDAGTAQSGQPYFVMELVKGIPITSYCDEKRLTVAERLELFITVCQAVQHAHHKGIIHRDLKPSNVLVAEYDNHAAAKIIDFGVAKATSQRLTERTLFTEFGQMIGTMEYMSPEQAKLDHLDVDTRSDIYSLGVLLYELLTGSTPFERKRLHDMAFDEMLRIVREEEPLWPSTRLSNNEALPSIAADRCLDPKKLTGLVSGELDCIVMKCLEKERDRRYATADHLADEFRRFLCGEPIQARSTTNARRLWRWYVRHEVSVAGGYMVFTSLIVGFTHILLFAILQFLIHRPTWHQLLAGLVPVAVVLLVCLIGAESGVAAMRGKRRGLWVSLIWFGLFSIGTCWTMYWGVEISRGISGDSVYSLRATMPNSDEGRNSFIRNCVVGYVMLGMIWAFLGLLLQLRAFNSPANDRLSNRWRG